MFWIKENGCNPVPPKSSQNCCVGMALEKYAVCKTRDGQVGALNSLILKSIFTYSLMFHHQNWHSEAVLMMGKRTALPLPMSSGA